MKKMAKKIIFVCTLLALSVSAGAQYSSVMAGDTSLTDGGKAIVRNMSPSEVITYVWAGTKQWFTYENNTSLTYSYIDLPTLSADNIIVNDFRIINGIVYFCGVNNNMGEGVLGTFKATDLLNPPGTLVPVDYFNIGGTAELNRMEVYKDPGTGNPRVAAVGYRNGICGTMAQGVWVDCDGYMPGGSVPSVSIFNSYCSAPNDVEQWHDVVSTDDWVVLVGYGKVGGQEGIALRRFHKGNPTDPEIDNIYIFNEPENVAWSEIRAESIKQNDMAVVYRGERSLNLVDFNKFRIFDINNMKNINSQEYEVPYKSSIWEMAYMPTAKRVVVLSDFPTPVFLSNFAYIEPYKTATYSSVFVNDKDWRFQSLTNLDGKFFVGAGAFHFLLRDVSASYPANNFYSTTPVYCPSSSTLKVVIIDNIIMNRFFHPISPISPPINPGFANPPIRPIGSLNVRCLSN